MRTGLTSSRRRGWPLLLLAAPAAVAIWAGWVGLGEMSGFGQVHPLPGIADEFTLNSAITLPIGMEAYSAYALGTWLSARPMPQRARAFAAWSSLTALGLGLLGQVIYHLLISTGQHNAPGPVVVFVACLPVLVLGAGATLHHLLSEPVAGDHRHEAPSPVNTAEQPHTPRKPADDDLLSLAPAADEESTPERVNAVAVDVSDLLGPGREVAAELDAAGQKLTRRALVARLRERELSCSTDRATMLLAVLRDERVDHIGHLEAVS